MLPIVLTVYGAVSGFISAHTAVVSMLALAFVATMRDELPAPFNRVGVLVWCYSWLHDGLNAFINMRKPPAPTTQSLAGLGTVTILTPPAPPAPIDRNL